MRLLRLYIHEHRVLKELDISFDPFPNGKQGQSGCASNDIFNRNYHLDFLVGVNGTGKSTVLRLLGRIFRHSFAELQDLPFILEYYLDSKDEKIRIANIDPEKKTPLESFSIMQVNGLDGDLDKQEAIDADALDSGLLPERIIAYTTGSESEWFASDEHDPFEQSDMASIQGLSAQERALQEMPGWSAVIGEARPGSETPRFRFIWQEQLPLVALAGLLLHSAQPHSSPLTKVLQEANIKRLAGFSLQFNLAYSTPGERAGIWQIFGQHANRAIRSGGTLLLVFQPDKFSDVLEASGGPLAFFERLADWQRRDIPLLVKAHLFLERIPEEGNSIVPPLHTWEWLSDGERSFIGRMCLFMLFGEVESLILLDEPEVHFNDYWKRHIVSLMSKVFEKKTAKSHVLIATHSSISLSDVPWEDVIILKRSGVLTSEISYPNIPTFGADPSDIMVHVFNAPHAMGEYSVDEIERWIEKAWSMSSKEREIYLSAKLEQIPPGYWAYRIRREMMGWPNDS